MLGAPHNKADKGKANRNHITALYVTNVVMLYYSHKGPSPHRMCRRLFLVAPALAHATHRVSAAVYAGHKSVLMLFYRDRVCRVHPTTLRTGRLIAARMALALSKAQATPTCENNAILTLLCYYVFTVDVATHVGVPTSGGCLRHKAHCRCALANQLGARGWEYLATPGPRSINL